MSTDYIYPEQVIKLNVELEIDINWLSFLSGISKGDILPNYNELLESGKIHELIKGTIKQELCYNSYRCSTDHTFDEIDFSIGGLK